MRFDPDLGWTSVPDTRLENFYGPGRHLTINGQGVRAKRAYAAEPPAGRRRALCAGDAFTLGPGVDDDSTWCAQLEQIEPQLETVNLGQGGYGLDQIYPARPPRRRPVRLRRAVIRVHARRLLAHGEGQLQPLRQAGAADRRRRRARGAQRPGPGQRPADAVARAQPVGVRAPAHRRARAPRAARAAPAGRHRAHRGRARGPLRQGVRRAGAPLRTARRGARVDRSADLRRLRESERALARADRARGAQARHPVHRSRRGAARAAAQRRRAALRADRRGRSARQRDPVQRGGPRVGGRGGPAPPARPAPRRRRARRVRAPDRRASTTRDRCGDERILRPVDSRRHDRRRQRRARARGDVGIRTGAWRRSAT